ncbi:ATP-binding protein [Bradyrhizobium sp. JR4.1]|uniref:ATP-binding protein n=1 Tax=Bradyrhizobium sp. JR4.1 TaxID=3156372 RepID=UPI00339307C1
MVATANLDRLLHHSHVLTICGDSCRAKRKSSLIKPPAADALRSAPPLSVTSAAEPAFDTEIMNPRERQFFMTQRGQFQMAFLTPSVYRYVCKISRLSRAALERRVATVGTGRCCPPSTSRTFCPARSAAGRSSAPIMPWRPSMRSSPAA